MEIEALKDQYQRRVLNEDTKMDEEKQNIRTRI